MSSSFYFKQDSFIIHFVPDNFSGWKNNQRSEIITELTFPFEVFNKYQKLISEIIIFRKNYILCESV